MKIGHVHLRSQHTSFTPKGGKPVHVHFDADGVAEVDPEHGAELLAVPGFHMLPDAPVETPAPHAPKSESAPEEEDSEEDASDTGSHRSSRRSARKDG